MVATARWDSNKTTLLLLDSPKDMRRKTAPINRVPISRLMQQQHFSNLLQCDILPTLTPRRCPSFNPMLSSPYLKLLVRQPNSFILKQIVLFHIF